MHGNAVNEKGKKSLKLDIFKEHDTFYLSTLGGNPIRICLRILVLNTYMVHYFNLLKTTFLLRSKIALAFLGLL